MTFRQNGGDLISQLVLKVMYYYFNNFFRDINTNDIDNNKNLWQDYKVINNIEFGDMFTEFYGKYYKKIK